MRKGGERKADEIFFFSSNDWIYREINCPPISYEDWESMLHAILLSFPSLVKQRAHNNSSLSRENVPSTRYGR